MERRKVILGWFFSSKISQLDWSQFFLFSKIKLGCCHHHHQPFPRSPSEHPRWTRPLKSFDRRQCQFCNWWWLTADPLLFFKRQFLLLPFYLLEKKGILFSISWEGIAWGDPMTLARHLKFLRKAHTEICHDQKGGQIVNHFTGQSKIHFDEEISWKGTCQRPGYTQRTASGSEEKGETP